MINVSEVAGRLKAMRVLTGKGRVMTSALASSALMLLMLLGAGQARAATTTEIELPAAVVAEYAEDFDTSSEVAESNLRLQQEGAALGELLRQVMGNAFGGLWFDNEAGQFVVPVPPSADREAVTEAVAALGLAPGSVRLAAVDSTWKELESGQERVGTAVSARSRLGLARTWLDPRTDSVVLEEAATAPVRAAAALVPDVGVAVETRRSTEPNFDVETRSCIREEPRVCDSPLRGGVELGVFEDNPEGFPIFRNRVCTTGFKAVGKQFGNRFVLTAGHCVYAHPNLAWGSDTTTDSSGIEIGRVEEYKYGEEGDWAKIKANGSFWDTDPWPSEVAHFGENEEYPIADEAWDYLGEYVCLSGAESGTTCGNIEKLRVTGLHNSLDGHALPPEDEAPGICTIDGDSGGPIYAPTGNTALGLESAGRGEGKGTECSGSTALFVEIIPATENLGVTVGARIGGAPILSEGGATNVAQTTATLNGAVYPNAVETTYRFEYATTTSYGSSIPVPDGNVGHGTGEVPVSANLTGLSPLTTYHWRIVASSPAGTTIGADQTFETLPEPPRLVTAPAEEIGTAEATLTGSVNPHGSPTTYYFAWGTSYSSLPNVTPESSAGEGTHSEPVRQVITGLEPGHEYFFQLMATNAGGTSRGSIGHLVTPEE